MPRRLPAPLVAESHCMPSDVALHSLDRFVDRAGQLYTLPAVAVQVLDLTCQPQVELRALQQCIENDPR